MPAGSVFICIKRLLFLKRNCPSQRAIEPITDEREACSLHQVRNYAPSSVKGGNSAYISSVSDQSIKDPHVKLFRDLFIGREDVYAERWESKDGRLKKSFHRPRFTILEKTYHRSKTKKENLQ